MIEPTGSKLQTGFEIRQLEIGELLQNLLSGETRCEQIENVAHADAHAAHTRTAAALFRIGSDSLSKSAHRRGVYKALQAEVLSK